VFEKLKPVFLIIEIENEKSRELVSDSFFIVLKSGIHPDNYRDLIIQGVGLIKSHPQVRTLCSFNLVCIYPA